MERKARIRRNQVQIIQDAKYLKIICPNPRGIKLKVAEPEIGTN